MIDVDELIKALRRDAKPLKFGVSEKLPCGYAFAAADALKQLQAENKAMRNELCQKCGRYIDEHNGSCNGCKWRKGRE